MGFHSWLLFLSLLHLKADDTYLQLKKDLEYLDLKVSGLRGLLSLALTFLSVSLIGDQPQSQRPCGSYKSGFQMKVTPICLTNTISK